MLCSRFRIKLLAAFKQQQPSHLKPATAVAVSHVTFFPSTRHFSDTTKKGEEGSSSPPPDPAATDQSQKSKQESSNASSATTDQLIDRQTEHDQLDDGGGIDIWSFAKKGKVDYGDPDDFANTYSLDETHPSKRYWKFAYKYWWLFGPTKVKRYLDSMEETGIRRPPDAGEDWTQPPSHWEPGMPTRPFLFDEIPPLKGPRPWQIWESVTYVLYLIPGVFGVSYLVREGRRKRAEHSGLFYCLNDAIVEEHIQMGLKTEEEREAYTQLLDARTRDAFDNKNQEFYYPRTRTPVSDSPLMFKLKGFLGLQQNPHLHQDISKLTDDQFKELYEYYYTGNESISPAQAVQQAGSDYYPEQFLLQEQ